MTSTHRPSPRRRRAVMAAMALLCASAPAVHAQHGGGEGQGSDHSLVVVRTVQPRIAYRGFAPTDNPVRVQATTFPGRVFHATLDAGMTQLVGDGDLTVVGSAGIDSAAGHRPLPPLQAIHINRALPPGAGSPGSSPLGAGAAPGGAVSAATGGVGNLMQGRLLPALGVTAGGGG